MNQAMEPRGPDFNTLVQFLEGELARADADERAIVMASQRSFAMWAQNAIGAVAESLGLSVGFLAGYLAGIYHEIRDGFRSGWRKGIEKGRLRP
jgi:hypothetical protein